MIALFGDVHGQLDGMYELVEQYNRRHDRPIETVLQAGDLGAFPDLDRLDLATRQMLKKDPTEAGFQAYHVGLHKVPVATWFVPGNHEDFDFLGKHRGGTVDAFGQLYCLDNGRIVEIQPGVCVAGIWGMRRHDSRSQRGDTRKYISQDACFRLIALAQHSVDILLCHDVPCDPADPGQRGSEDLTEVVSQVQPRYVFHGHVNRYRSPWQLGASLVVGLNEAPGVRIPGRESGMGLLDPRTWKFRWVTKEDL